MARFLDILFVMKHGGEKRDSGQKKKSSLGKILNTIRKTGKSFTTAPEVAGAILKVIAEIPQSEAEFEREDPDAVVDRLIERAAWKSAGIAGSLAMPSGPLGVLTILPSLYAIWKLQAQLIADIAAVYGKSAELKRETMLFCLFRHGAASVLSETIAQSGTRFVIRNVSFEALQRIVGRIGVQISEAIVKNLARRMIPLAGAVASGAFARYDTQNVGKTARELFSGKIDIDSQRS